MPIDILTGQLDAQTIRLLAGIAVVAMLGWWTVERASGDGDDPSMYFGGDWLLFRASGIAIIGLAVISAGVLLFPWMNGGLGLLLAGVFVYWAISEEEERE